MEGAMFNSSALRIENLSKSLQNNQILKDFDLTIKEAEIHALLGLNETGKTTLVKILAGLIPPDSGKFWYFGEKINSFAANFLKRNGGEIMYDQSYLFPDFSIAENVCFQPDRIIKKADAIRQTKDIFDKLNISIDPSVLIGSTNRAQRKLIDFARIAYNHPRFVLLDEPFELLSIQEIKPLIVMLKELKETGGSILITSHRMHEILELADRVSILSSGKIQKTIAAGELSVADIIGLLSNHKVNNPYPKIKTSLGKSVLQVRNLTIPNVISDISFDLQEGEILGFYGDSNSGRNMLAKTIFGVVPEYYGHININGVRLRPGSQSDAIKNGIAYVTDDPHNFGIFENLNVTNNLFVVSNNSSGKKTCEKETDHAAFKHRLRYTNLLPRNLNTKMYVLSAGMMQRINLLKWFFTKSNVFIIDEPTTNVDSVAKVDIYNLVNDLVKKGAGVMLISSDIHELAGMCDRIFIMEDGKITVQLNPKENLPDEIILKRFI